MNESQRQFIPQRVEYVKLTAQYRAPLSDHLESLLFIEDYPLN
jgi:hypothetical protein